MKRKGFSLVELMVVVAIIAILTAIALPMYSTFRRRAYTQNAVGPCNDMRKGLTAFFQDSSTFDQLAFRGVGPTAPGGALEAFHPDVTGNGGITPTGTALPPARGLSWTVAGQAGDAAAGAWRARVDFVFDPAVCLGCTGVYCLLCDQASGVCVYEVDVDEADNADNPLNSMDKNKGSACAVATVAAAQAIISP